MAYATNDAEVKAMLTPPLQQAVKYTVDKIKELNLQEIDEIVYSYTPSEYGRTYTFRDAWDYELGGGSGISADFHWAPEHLGYHPSIVTGDDIRDGLADIIYQGQAGRILGEGFWTKKRDAFKALQNALGKNQLRKFFEAGMTSAGLNWKRRGGISMSKS